MKYDIIFYISKKTGYCEKKLRASLKTVGGELNRVLLATSPSALGEETMKSLRTCPLAVIIGGLKSLDDDNLATVLSRVFSNSGLTLSNMRRLTCEKGLSGYVIRYKTQAILALPDDPEAIDEMLSEKLLNFLREKTEP